MQKRGYNFVFSNNNVFKLVLNLSSKLFSSRNNTEQKES
jgi:hypothetical protein